MNTRNSLPAETEDKEASEVTGRQMNDTIYDQRHRTEYNLQWRRLTNTQYHSPKHMHTSC